MNTKFFALLSLIVAATIQANAALVNFSFTGAAGNETSFAPDSQPGHLTVSDMVRGSGLTTDTTAGTFVGKSWTTSVSIDANDYFAFSITPEAGFGMTLTQLLLDERRSGTGILNWSVRSSLDSFVSDLATFGVPDNTSTRTDQSLLLPPNFGNLNSAIEFRIYGYAAESGSGTWRIDNVRVEGNVSRTSSAVPETLPFAFVIVFLIGLLFSHYLLTRANTPKLSRIRIPRY